MVERDVSDGTTERTWSRSELSAGRTSKGTGAPGWVSTVTCALTNFSPRWRHARPASPAAIAKAHNTNRGIHGLLVGGGGVSCPTNEGVALGYVGDGCDGTTIAGVLGRVDTAVGVSVSQVVNEFSLNDGVGVGDGKFGGITMYELMGGSVMGASVVVGSVVVGSVVVGSVVVGSVVVGSVVVGSVVVGSVVVGSVVVAHGSASA